MSRVFAAFAALIGLLALTAPLSAQDFPELTGRVVDQADIIPADLEAQITSDLEALETQSQRQLVVVTLNSLDGYDIADYGYQLGRHWGIGDAERNDGALLIVAPNDRKVRIEVGYGLEGILTDALSSVIINQTILPRFREGDMAGGIQQGTGQIVNQLLLSEDEARLVAQQATERQSEPDGIPIGTLIWFAFIFFFFILPILRGGKRRRYRSGARGAIGDIILWEAGKAIARGASGGRSGGGWSSGGGGFSGGGFSGGGGSFGGGGASGGW